MLARDSVGPIAGLARVIAAAVPARFLARGAAGGGRDVSAVQRPDMAVDVADALPCVADARTLRRDRVSFAIARDPVARLVALAAHERDVGPFHVASGQDM